MKRLLPILLLSLASASFAADAPVPTPTPIPASQEGQLKLGLQIVTQQRNQIGAQLLDAQAQIAFLQQQLKDALDKIPTPTPTPAPKK